MVRDTKQGRSGVTDAMVQILAQIAEQFGTQTLADGKRTVAFFADLAPEMPRERRLLTIFVDYGGHSVLLAAVRASKAQQKTAMERLVRDMMEDLFLTETAARTVCDAFWTALTGERRSGEETAAKPSDPTPRARTTAARGREPGGHTPMGRTPPPTPVVPQPVSQPVPGPAQKQPGGQRTVITSYKSYITALTDYLHTLGGGKLTEEQIRGFIRQHQLDRRFGITQEDVRRDLEGITGRSPGFAAKTPGTPSGDPVTPGTKPGGAVSNYRDYRNELQLRFLQNGRRPLSRQQIMEFIRQYNLDRRFGITAQDVDTDLREIARG